MAQENAVEVQLDGEKIMMDEEMTLGAVTEELRNRLPDNRVLTEILVDDQAIDVEEEERLRLQLLSKMGPLHFKSQDVRFLLKDSLKLAPQVCEALLLDVQDIESFFQQNEFIQANERIADLSSLVDWLLQMVTTLEAHADFDLRSLQLANGETGASALEKMDGVLKQLHSELHAQKYDQFREILKGDFAQAINLWRGYFMKLQEIWLPESS